jgi:hypothetical protein
MNKLSWFWRTLSYLNSFSTEANSFSACQWFPVFYGTENLLPLSPETVRSTDPGDMYPVHAFQPHSLKSTLMLPPI